jgi:hypothetical protein
MCMQWRREGGAYGFIRTQSIHQCTHTLHVQFCLSSHSQYKTSIPAGTLHDCLHGIMPTLLSRVYNRWEEREYRTSSITPLKFKMQSHMTNGRIRVYARRISRQWSIPGARDLLGILNIDVRYSLSSPLLYTLVIINSTML